MGCTLHTEGGQGADRSGARRGAGALGLGHLPERVLVALSAHRIALASTIPLPRFRSSAPSGAGERFAAEGVVRPLSRRTRATNASANPGARCRRSGLARIVAPSSLRSRSPFGLPSAGPDGPPLTSAPPPRFRSEVRSRPVRQAPGRPPCRHTLHALGCSRRRCPKTSQDSSWCRGWGRPDPASASVTASRRGSRPV